MNFIKKYWSTGAQMVIVFVLCQIWLNNMPLWASLTSIVLVLLFGLLVLTDTYKSAMSIVNEVLGDK